MHTHKLIIKQPLFSSYKRVGHFSAASHLCEKANVMMADATELKLAEAVPVPTRERPN
jgi:hypothetical protein